MLLDKLLWLCDECFLLFFPTLDANAEEEEEGAAEAFEEEDQGHFANQGKPPLDAYLNPIVLNALFYKFIKVHVLLFINELSD